MLLADDKLAVNSQRVAELMSPLPLLGQLAYYFLMKAQCAAHSLELVYDEVDKLLR